MSIKLGKAWLTIVKLIVSQIVTQTYNLFCSVVGGNGMEPKNVPEYAN